MESGAIAGERMALEVAPPAGAHGRDALIFLLISAAGIFGAALVAILFRGSREADVAQCVAWSLGMVTALCGIWKSERARAAGLSTRGAIWIHSTLWLIATCAGMLAYAYLEHCLPSALEHPGFWA